MKFGRSTGSRGLRYGGALVALAFVAPLFPTVGEAQTVEWVRSDGGAGEDIGREIAVDAAGNTYVTGGFKGTATFGPFMLTSAGDADIFVAKYDAGGNVLWAKRAGGAKIDTGLGITVDVMGNTYVTGFFLDTATFGSFTLNSAGVDDIFVAKYDASGNVLWARSAGGTRFNEQGFRIAVDTAGNTYVTGQFQGTAIFGSFTLNGVGESHTFVAKFDPNGNVLWAQSAGGPLRDRGGGIGVDADGNSYVAGTFQGTATYGPFTLTSSGDFDIFVAKYDTSGNVLWAHSAGGTSGDDDLGLDIDAAGNSYVTGYFGGTATFGPFTITSAGGDDIFVAKYDASGNVLWVKSAGGAFVDRGLSIAVDAASNSYVAGGIQGTATFGAFTLTSFGDSDVFVAKYDGSGNVLWAASAGGTSFDRGFGIDVDPPGNIYVTGSFEGIATFGSFMLTSAGDQDIFVAKYGVSVCGDGSLDLGEECDGGTGCTDCLCDANFEPIIPPSLDCQPTCGNGELDSAEECDGGLGCTDCICDAGFEPMVPPSLDCQPTCGNGAVDPGEECDGGVGCMACQCDPVFEPTIPPSLDCQATCGNGICGPGEDACTCPVDCVGGDDCDMNGTPDVCEGTRSLNFCVKCDPSLPSGECSNDKKWLFRLSWPAPGASYADLSCGPVPLTGNTTAADLAAAFVDCINATVCPSITAAQFGPGKCFRVVVPGTITPDLCVKPADGLSGYCCPQPICIFNPGLIEVQLGNVDCNDNNQDDAIDIALDTSNDCNQNRIPDECDLDSGVLMDDDGDGVPDECDVVPTMTGWGLIVLVLLMLAGIAIKFGRRRPVSA